MVLIYAFSNHWGTNISRRVLSDLQKLIPPSSQIIYQSIHFHPRQFFQKYIANNQYDLIIGLGDYSGPGQKVRIETAAHNRYGQKEIYPFSPYKLDLSLPTLDLVDTSAFAVGEHMGTYNCNWIAYEIQRLINSHHLSTYQLFFHLPQKANSALLASNLNVLLHSNQMIK